MKTLAYEYARSIQPGSPHNEVFDALQLQKCGHAAPNVPSPFVPVFDFPKGSIFVSDLGNDSASGTLVAPLRTLHAAIKAAAAVGEPSTILLRAGTFFLGDTLELSNQVSGLTIMNYPGEEVWISGGTPLVDLKWSIHKNVSAGKRIWVADLGSIPVSFDQALGLNSLTPFERMTRARYPNRDPTSGTIENGWLDGNSANARVTWEKPTPWSSSASSVYVETPNADEIHAGDCGTHFTYGIGGPCDRYSPAGGYLCSANATGGGFGWEQMVPGAPLFPVGLQYNTTVFTDERVPPPSEWNTPKDTGTTPILQTWTNGWCTTMWEFEPEQPKQSSENESSLGSEILRLKFTKGGQQTGRGFHIESFNPKDRLNTEGGWRVENALELLDQPEEFFYAPNTKKLYLFYNGTDLNETPAGRLWVVPTLKTLVNIKGRSAKEPLQNVTIKGLNFRDTAYTYMDEWGVPSGGDWALHRGGGLFIESAEDVTLHQCRFEQMDGNAVFLSGYTRGVEVSNSSFQFIGDNAMAAWGHTSTGSTTGNTTGSSGATPTQTLQMPPGAGIDGTSGEQPRGTRVIGNFVRDIGFNERQSSAWGEFKACASTVEGNIFFNMPRAAININDGFGGGTLIQRNLLFNTCRESGDHGPFNSWDRQPYLTELRTGSPSLIPEYNVIASNFIISNYGAGFGVDNDDTSSYYKIHTNVMYMGGGIKCDYDGHEKRFYDNLMVGQAGGAACHHTCAYKYGYTDYCYNNTIVQASPADPKQQVEPYAIIWFCDKANVSRILPDYSNEMLPVIHSNKIYNRDGNATVTCGYSGVPSERTPLKTFLDHGLMQNTEVLPLPSNSEIAEWAHALLKF